MSDPRLREQVRSWMCDHGGSIPLAAWEELRSLVGDPHRPMVATACSPEGSREDEHPPIYPDEHGDWQAANTGAHRTIVERLRIKALEIGQRKRTFGGHHPDGRLLAETQEIIYEAARLLESSAPSTPASGEPREQEPVHCAKCDQPVPDHGQTLERERQAHLIELREEARAVTDSWLILWAFAARSRICGGREMALLDYQCPDIVYGESEIVYQIADCADTVVVVRTPRGRHLALRVHARRESKSHIMSCRYWTWDCTHPKGEGLCGYAPSHEDMPPIPGQRCHNCGGLRAEEIPTAGFVATERHGSAR